MTPAQLVALLRIGGLLLIAAAGAYGLKQCADVYNQAAVELPAARSALAEQKELTKAAERERDDAREQAKHLQAAQAEIAEREAENEDKRRHIADPDAVLRRLVGVCKHSVELPGDSSATYAASGLAAGGAEADDPRDGDALAGIAYELREVPADDDNHEALAQQWCRLKAARREPQPGCPSSQ